MTENFKRFGGSKEHNCHYTFYDSFKKSIKSNSDYLIPRGKGNSYVEASFLKSSTSIKTNNIDRIISFDKTKGIIELESGVTLGKLYNFLIKRNYYLSIQPGYPNISIGGCVASNVHGKNPSKDGLIEKLVIEIELFHKDFGLMKLSRKINKKIFDLTIGGYGLTGLITKVKLKVSKIKSYSIIKKGIRVNGFKDAILKMNSVSDKVDLFYVWMDLVSKSISTCEGVLVTGEFSKEESKSDRFIDYKSRKNLNLFNFYFRPTLKIINWIFKKKLVKKVKQDLKSFLFPAIDNFLYFYLYGSKGFIEQQFLIPEKKVSNFLEELENLLNSSKPLIVLATLKLFNGRRKNLHFNDSGVCITFDYCNNNNSIKFINNLYPLIIKHNGISNIIKDSLLNKNLVQLQYKKNFANFKKNLNDFDNKRVYQSLLSEKLGV